MATPTKSQLVGMVATLRGLLHSWKFQHTNPDAEDLEGVLAQTDEVMSKTTFDADDEDLISHPDGGLQFDKTWRWPE